MKVEGGQSKANTVTAVARISEAAAAGAKVVLLPEAFTLGWTHPSAVVLAEPIPEGPSCQALMAAAKENSVYLCAGFVEQTRSSIFNSAILIDPLGEVVLRHRKINELDIAHGLYAQGDRLGVVKTPLGTIGLMICADAFATGQVISRTLGLMGADVILSPSSWAVSANHDNIKDPYGKLWLESYGIVARDFGIWIAGVSNVGLIASGPWSGRKCIGCSLVVNPDGVPVVQGSYGEDAEEILYIEILSHLRPTRSTGWMNHVPLQDEVRCR